VETGAEGNGTLVGVDLDITERLVDIGGDDDVYGLDGTRERLVQVLLGDLELEKSAIDLVDDDDRLDALTKSLTEHSLGLDAHTLDGVDDNESTIGDTESGGNFGREINVTGRVNQVDQEVLAVGLLPNNILEVLLIGEGSVKGDGCGLDGDTTFLLVRTGVRCTSLTRLSGRDNTGLREERVGEGGLSVIDVSNDGHVAHVSGLVHQLTDLIDREVDHLGGVDDDLLKWVL